MPRACLSGCARAFVCQNDVQTGKFTLDMVRGHEASLNRLLDNYGPVASEADLALLDRAEAETNQAATNLNAAVHKARDLGWACQGPNELGDCMSPSIRYPSTGNRPRLALTRKVASVALPGLLAIGLFAGYNYLHTAEENNTPVATGDMPEDQQDGTCLVGIVSGLSEDACDKVGIFPPVESDDAPSELPSAAPDTSIDPACIDTGLYPDGADPTPAVLAGYVEADRQDWTAVPAEYRHIISKVMQRPAIARMLNSIKSPILMWYTDNQENGMFVSYTDPSLDRIDLCFGGTADSERLFRNQASLEHLLVHESSHGLHIKWDDISRTAEGEKTGQLLNKLEDANASSMEAAGERFRILQGQAVIDNLHKLKAQFDDLGRGHISDGVQLLIDQYQQPDGLNNQVFNSYTTGYGNLQSVTDQLRQALADVGIGVTEEDTEDIDFTPLGDANDLLFGFFEKAFAHINEGLLVRNPEITVTHPYDNVNEYVASAISSVYINPDGVIKAIDVMPYDQRAMEVEKLELLLELVQENDPGLLENIELERVVNALRNPHAGIVTAAETSDRIHEFAAAGRRGWMVLSPEQAAALAS